VRPDQAEKVNKLTQEIRDAISSNNLDTIKAKSQELKNVLAEISTAAYQSAGAAPSGAAGPQAGAAGPEAGFAGGGGSAAGPNPNP
jgi:molecular chaperone DnaK